MEPFDHREIKPEYKNSILNLGVKPEYNIGEVSLAALYRQIGWKDSSSNKRYSEGRVTEESSKFFKKVQNQKSTDSDLIDIEDWDSILNKSLSTPKMPNQAKSPYPILYPFVPDCTLYSNAARLKGNPWNPGNLIEKTILVGSKNNKEAKRLWEKLFNALSCDPKDEQEDIFGRIVSQEFEKYRPENICWEINSITESQPEFDDDVIKASPARQFTEDLDKVIELKSSLTRREWLAILETTIRVGTATHILWTCSINSIVWDFLKNALKGNPIPKENLKNQLINESRFFWNLEEKAKVGIENQIRGYLKSQIGINFLIDYLEAQGKSASLDSIDNIYSIGQQLATPTSESSTSSIILDKIYNLFEIEPTYFNCKKGPSKNLSEFIQYSLRQKQTAEKHKRNYDQSYWLKKKGDYNSAPWIIELGPVAILMTVYCCSYGYDQNRTIKDFIVHLNNYGISLNEKDLEDSNLMKTLSTLQVIGDSPDAEGGMIIINPFN